AFQGGTIRDGGQGGDHPHNFQRLFSSFIRERTHLEDQASLVFAIAADHALGGRINECSAVAVGVSEIHFVDLSVQRNKKRLWLVRADNDGDLGLARRGRAGESEQQG